MTVSPERLMDKLRKDFEKRSDMVLIDIPDKYAPRRCAVYVNEITRSSLLNCNFDDAGAPFPQSEEE